MTDVFQELAQYRQQLGLPIAGSETDRTTIAKLEIREEISLGLTLPVIQAVERLHLR